MILWLLIWLEIKKLNQIIPESFIRGRKLNFSNVFITQSCFIEKDVGINYTNFFIMKIPNKRELQQTAFHHWSDIDFEHFMNLYKTFMAKPYSFWVIDTTLASDDFSRFRMYESSQKVYCKVIFIFSDWYYSCTR